jgi:uncharacterized membrane protein
VSRTRVLIEAYGLPPGREREEQDESRNVATKKDEREAALVRALDFLDSCLSGFGETDEATVVEPRTELLATPEPKHVALQIPRGLLYWVSVVTAATVSWRLNESLLHAAIASLLASATIIVLEIVLRLIDPRMARRLGLAQGRTDALIYSAAACFGIAAGAAIAYLV